VQEGAAVSALLHDHAGCAPRRVLDALRLDWSAVFPTSTRGRRSRSAWQAPAREPNVVVLDAVLERGLTYQPSTNGDLWAIDACPACHGGSLWITRDHRGRVGASCLAGCPQAAIFDALAGLPT